MLTDGLQRDAGSFAQVYASERVAIIRLAYVLVRSQAVAEELAHDAFLVLHQRFSEVDNPAGFLRTAVVRLATRWRSRNEMEGRRLAAATPATVHEPRDLDETWQALGRLHPDRAVVLVLRYYADLSHDEIARVLGCSAGTVRSRTRRALADLRKELA